MKLNQQLREEPRICLRDMDTEEEDRKPGPTLSVLQRLDRLDQLMQMLEEKHCLSARHAVDLVWKKIEPRDECKTVSSALEEVHHKGTLVERLATLEDRVLQLSLEVESGNTWKSSSSGAPFAEKNGNNESDTDTPVIEASMVPGEVNNLSPLKTRQQTGYAANPKARGEGKRSLLMRRMEWFGCFKS